MAHLDKCPPHCAVRHCECGVPARQGMWVCGKPTCDATNRWLARRGTRRR